MENLLPKSIEERALNNMATGMGAIDAVKLAIDQEENLIISLIGSGYLTERGKTIASILCKEIYTKINHK